MPTIVDMPLEVLQIILKKLFKGSTGSNQSLLNAMLTCKTIARSAYRITFEHTEDGLKEEVRWNKDEKKWECAMDLLSLI